MIALTLVAIIVAGFVGYAAGYRNGLEYQCKHR